MLYTNVSVMFYTTTCNKGDGLAYFVDNDNSNDNTAAGQKWPQATCTRLGNGASDLIEAIPNTPKRSE